MLLDIIKMGRKIQETKTQSWPITTIIQMIGHSMDVEKMMFVAVLCLLTRAIAQDESDRHAVDPLHPSMAVVLTVLSILLCATFLVLAYAKFCDRRHEPHQLQDERRGDLRTRSRFSGIDRAVVESLPFFQFSSLHGLKEGLECSVCLSRFEDIEILRLLPRCRHAFHMGCIDKWLENHSSCPLCRYKFNEGDLKNMTQTSSFRYLIGEEPHLEFHIQREQSQGRSSRFNIASTIQNLARGRRDEPLIREFMDRRLLHSFRHKIIVSDVMYKSRWSDLNSSDLMSLSSHMLKDLSSQRFSSFGTGDQELVLKMKQDMEINDIEHNSTAGTSRCNHVFEHIPTSDPSQKRSMSEITNISRFERTSGISRVNMEKDNKVRRVWMSIARKTIQRFSGEPQKHSEDV